MMRNRLHRAMLPLIATVGFLLAGCMWGGGTDADSSAPENRVLFPSGLPAPGLVVRLFPADLDPFAQPNYQGTFDVTAKDGSFRISQADTGIVYNLLTRDALTGLIGYADSILVRGTLWGFQLRLDLPRRVEIRARNAGSDTSSLAGKLFAPGTDIRVECVSIVPCRVLIPKGAGRLVFRADLGWERTLEVPAYEGEDTLKLQFSAEGPVGTQRL